MHFCVSRYPAHVRRFAPLLLAAALAVALSGVAAGALPPTKGKGARAQWRSLLHWPASCESEWHSPGVAQSLGGLGVMTYPAQGQTLAVVDCYYGAYQGTFMLFLVDSARHVTGPIALHLYQDPGSGKPKAIYEKMPLGVFSFKKGVLTIFDKGVGYGGCGIYSVFKLTGSTFVPVESHAKMDCNGNPPHDPARWPRLPTLGA